VIAWVYKRVTKRGVGWSAAGPMLTLTLTITLNHYLNPKIDPITIVSHVPHFPRHCWGLCSGVGPIAKNGGGYTQRGVAKGLKVPCLFMITEVSIRCKKTRRLVYAVYPRIPPPPIHHWAYAEQGLRNYRPYVCLDIRLTHSAAACRCCGFAAVAPGAGREREKKYSPQSKQSM